MIKALQLLIVIFLTSGCVTGGEKIKDFSDRSVGYGWLNIKSVDVNRLHSVVLYQYSPKSDKPYYHAAVKKFKGGYLYYTFALPKGAFGTYSATGQFCLGLCSNTIHTYTFGKQSGDVSKVSIENPGVYNFGSYALKEVKTGIFKPNEFDAVPAENAPSQEAMLQEILKAAKGNTVMASRIKAALDSL